jgi:hypothetical protein
MNTLENILNIKNELIISSNAYAFLKNDEIIIAEKKNQNLIQQRLSLNETILYFNKETPLNFYDALKDPISFEKHVFSYPIFNKEINYTFFLKEDTSEIFRLPGVVFPKEITSHFENETQRSYEKKFQGTFSIIENNFSTIFNYKGKFVALNHFFGFLLDDEILVEGINLSTTLNQINQDVLKKALRLLNSFWIEEKHFFKEKNKEVKIFYLNQKLVKF